MGHPASRGMLTALKRRSSEVDDEFNDFVRMHVTALRNYVRRRLPPSSVLDAEDVITDVFTIAWLKRSKIPVGFETAWLLGVARNRILNQIDKSRRRSVIDRKITGSGPQSSAEEEAIADLALRDALRQLSTSEREVLLLSAWEGQTNSEIAVTLGLSTNAAAVRLSRAKSALVRLLDLQGDVMTGEPTEELL